MFDTVPIRGIPFWTRLRLLFRSKKHYGPLIVKVMDGTIYVIEEKK